MTDGAIAAGVLAPHPPHLIYAENPPQNEPRSEGGWEELRWGYERLRDQLATIDYDVLVVHSPHWRTVVGHHFLGVPSFKSLSVDPVFPNLFRYHFDMNVDVSLAEMMCEETKSEGLPAKMMRNPHFRVDYGTIIACHLINPTWDKPIVGVSANMAYSYFSNDVGQRQMMSLGKACTRALKKSGKRAVFVGTTSLSHRHFTVEPDLPEDMTFEHNYNHNQRVWDMRMLAHMKAGRSGAVLDEMPDFIEQTVSECDAGSLTWLLSSLDTPSYPATVHAYGTVIGTGNAIVSWLPNGGAA